MSKVKLFQILSWIGYTLAGVAGMLIIIYEPTGKELFLNVGLVVVLLWNAITATYISTRLAKPV